MSTTSKIEWTEKTWNPVRGCSLVSPGCKHCYAMKQAHRFSGEGGPYEGLTELGPDGPRWTGKIRLVHEALDAPLHWRKPARIFVNSMSDLFHEDVPFEFIYKVFEKMMFADIHTFQVLTKRSGRMKKIVTDIYFHLNRNYPDWHIRPLPNVWLGVSVENQKTADERIPLLLQTPAAVRWISAEPLLEEIDIEKYIWPGCNDDVSLLDWLVIGGESGPGARPFNIVWARKLIEQCKAAGVPVFMKQLGDKPMVTAWPVGQPNNPYTASFKTEIRKGGNPLEWPEDLRVREYPTSQLSTRNS